MKKNKRTPLHSTLKDQSRPSPRIQDHTVAAMGGRLDWGEVGEEGKERRRRRKKKKKRCTGMKREEYNVI